MRVPITRKMPGGELKAVATDDGWESDNTVFKKFLESMTLLAKIEYFGYQPIQGWAYHLALSAEKHISDIEIGEVIYEEGEESNEDDPEGTVY